MPFLKDRGTEGPAFRWAICQELHLSDLMGIHMM